jgi:ketosteroid isomerase-like protein
MRNTCIASLLLLAGLAVSCNPNTGAGRAGESVNTDELRDKLATTAEDWNRGDLDAFAAPYDTASTYMTQMGPIGRETMLEEYRRNFFEGDEPIQDLRFDQVMVRPLGSDHALMTGQYILSGGDQPDRSGWFSLVWLRTQEGWKILHDHSN